MATVEPTMLWHAQLPDEGDQKAVHRHNSIMSILREGWGESVITVVDSEPQPLDADVIHLGFMGRVRHQDQQVRFHVRADVSMEAFAAGREASKAQFWIGMRAWMKWEPNEPHGAIWFRPSDVDTTMFWAGVLTYIAEDTCERVGWDPKDWTLEFLFTPTGVDILAQVWPEWVPVYVSESACS